MHSFLESYSKLSAEGRTKGVVLLLETTQDSYKLWPKSSGSITWKAITSGVYE
jgi:hypothetical protein